VRDFRVARSGGVLIGCGALQLVNARLAEVRSIAVHPDWRGGGIGSRTVDALIEDAERLGVTQVFCLTRRQTFFARLGFHAVPKEDFPHKIWNDCRVCPRLQSCDEVAMQRTVRLRAGASPRGKGLAARIPDERPGAPVEVLPVQRHGAAIDVRRRDLDPEPAPSNVRFVRFAPRPSKPGRDS
jgi:N-acetylglutamate synthase-like GNAT family acetyltransferase